MIRLDTVNRSLRIVLSGAITTNQLPVTVAYSDKTSTSYSGGTQLSTTNSTTPVTICSAPAASTVRDIDYINIYNADTVAATVVVSYLDTATSYSQHDVTLQVDDTLTYTHAAGWVVTSKAGTTIQVTSVFGRTGAVTAQVGDYATHYAALAGSATQTFSAAAATVAAHVVRADQVLGILAAQSLIRLNTSNGYGSTNTVIRRFTNTVTSQGTDITYADSATNGASFTINVNGVYGIEYTDNFTGAGSGGISLNSSQLTTAIASITIADILSIGTGPAANQLCVSSWSGYLPAGAVIRAHTGGAAAGTSPVLFTIGRIG